MPKLAKVRSCFRSITASILGWLMGLEPTTTRITRMVAEHANQQLASTLPKVAACSVGFLAGCIATPQIAKPFPDGRWPARHAAPVWLAAPAVAIDVRWMRERGEPEVAQGVCVVRLEDSAHGLWPAERQLLACVAGGARATGRIPDGAVRVHWNQARDPLDAMARWQELFPGQSAHNIAGFYWHPDPSGPCHIVTSATQASAGHELKHCFDGAFHDQRGKWH